MSASVTNRLTAFSAKLRQRMEVRAESEIDQPDADLFRDVLVMRAALLYDLLSGTTLEPEIPTPVLAWMRTLSGLSSIQVELYAEDWKTLRSILTSADFLNRIGRDAGVGKQHFKDAAAGRIHYKWILNATLALFGGEDDDPEVRYALLNQWIVFDSRVNFSSLDLTTQCCEEYMAFERSLTAPCWSKLDECHPVRYVTRRAARDLFGQFVLTDYPFRPKHGNGATVEVPRKTADSWHKNRQFRYDSELLVYLKYRLSGQEWRSWFYHPYKGLNRTSTLVCVPKSMTSNRTISKEPTSLQFLQQDIFAALDDYFIKNMQGRIDLHDQSRSRALALIGSSAGSYATIDLSSASDSVTVSIVEELFGDLPVGWPLMATRSTHVRVTNSDMSIDTTIETQKFAPMGSATCFPVETMVFTTLCEAAVRLVTGRPSRGNDYVVYGDDIVIRTRYAKRVIDLLTLYGFRVNDTKSFWDDNYVSVWHFREACGIECLNGEDITPLRLSRRLVSLTNNQSDRQAGLGVGMVDLINRCFLYRFFTLRRWINDTLISHRWYRTCARISESDYRQFIDDISTRGKSSIRLAMPSVITPDGSDTQWRCFGLQSLSENAYQCMSALVSVVKQRRHASPKDSNDYYSWALASVTKAPADADYDIDERQIVTYRPRDLKWSKHWVSLPRDIRILTH